VKNLAKWEKVHSVSEPIGGTFRFEALSLFLNVFELAWDPKISFTMLTPRF
jgi:hypothetical protein